MILTSQRRGFRQRLKWWLQKPLRAKWTTVEWFWMIFWLLARGWLRGWQFDAHGRLFIGSHVKVSKRFGRLLMGDGVTLSAGCLLKVSGKKSRAEIAIGDRTYVGNRTSISAVQSIHIGADCRIGYDCWIVDNDHHSFVFAPGSAPLPPYGSVVVGDHVWIGHHSLVLKGASIGEGSVVGAGSVVRGRIAPHSLVIGNPARRIGWTEGWVDPPSDDA